MSRVALSLLCCSAFAFHLVASTDCPEITGYTLRVDEDHVGNSISWSWGSPDELATKCSQLPSCFSFSNYGWLKTTGVSEPSRGGCIWIREPSSAAEPHMHDKVYANVIDQSLVEPEIPTAEGSGEESTDPNEPKCPEIDGYTLRIGEGHIGNGLTWSDKGPKALAKICSNEAECYSFSTDGWLKTTIDSEPSEDGCIWIKDNVSPPVPDIISIESTANFAEETEEESDAEEESKAVGPECPEVEGYKVHVGRDHLGDDITWVYGNAKELASECSALPNCLSFNVAGWLKASRALDAFETPEASEYNCIWVKMPSTGAKEVLETSEAAQTNDGLEAETTFDPTANGSEVQNSSESDEGSTVATEPTEIAQSGESSQHRALAAILELKTNVLSLDRSSSLLVCGILGLLAVPIIVLVARMRLTRRDQPADLICIDSSCPINVVSE